MFVARSRASPGPSLRPCSMNFLPGFDRLLKARQILDQAGHETAETSLLIEAASNCWSAIIDSAAWPVELRMEATVFQRSIFRYGSLEATINQMSPSERQQLVLDIVQLASAAERAGTR